MSRKHPDKPPPGLSEALLNADDPDYVPTQSRSRPDVGDYYRRRQLRRRKARGIREFIRKQKLKKESQ